MEVSRIVPRPGISAQNRSIPWLLLSWLIISSGHQQQGHSLQWRHNLNSRVIMGVMSSQITSLTILYSTVCSGVDQRKQQSSVSLAFVRGIHRGPVNSPHKGPVTRKMFPFDDVIMFTVLDKEKIVFQGDGLRCPVPTRRCELRENANIFLCLLK